MNRTYSVILLALALFTTTFAVNLQAPLYAVYAAESNVGTTAVTVAFAAYVAGLMPTLLLLGGLSDRIGRRIPVLIALLLGTGATALLVIRPSWESLVVARLLLGIGTGLVTTAGNAYMAEIMGEANSRRAALIVTSATTLGFGGGALATSVSLNLQGPTLMPLSYVLLFAIAPILAIITLTLARVDKPRPVSLLRLPVFPAGTWVYGIAMVLAWSTSGVVIAVVPLELQAQGLGGWTGVVVFLAIFTGFLCQPFARRMKNATSLALGFALIPTGFIIIILGLKTSSIVWVLLGTCLTSAANYGFTYLGSILEVTTLAPDNRARATAGLFTYAYIGFSLPTVASGVLADNVGLLPAMTVFGTFLVIATILVVLIWTKKSTRSAVASA
ncbi:MFS transporter [Pseudomonas farris]